MEALDKEFAKAGLVFNGYAIRVGTYAKRSEGSPSVSC
jgi:hypothetical protein